MSIRAADIVPISEAKARLTELAEDIVAGGSEKVLTRNGASYVALVDARKLDYYHALEAEHGHLVLLDAARDGLSQAIEGRVMESDELDDVLARPLGRPAK